LETEDMTSTAICLIGLSRAVVAPSDLPLDPIRTTEALVDLSRRRAYPGGLGLVIWANAVWDGRRLGTLLEQVGQTLEGLAALAPRFTTMQVAWLASGLLHEVRRASDAATLAAAYQVIDELISRIVPHSGLFSHSGAAGAVKDRARRWVPN